ncbi:unnamed protein product [Peronospora belbahrii]|uniref:Reverse transcriptase Ty1/copia-type domain-containing protein n=1 Tax=Peronospora belbahrii TaxID=622444 RepID=A0AAU9LE25_9STRA|nr:unnamed protein product [Peronospora belbahrii]
MQVPEREIEGVGVKPSREVALLLKKSLYGLKQAGRLWSKLLHQKLIEEGFKQCTTDVCLYDKQEGDSWTVVGNAIDQGPKRCEKVFETLDLVE